MAFDYNAYHAEYNKNRYENIRIRAAKGSLQELKEYAALQDKSVNTLILEAVWKCYGIDLKTQREE